MALQVKIQYTTKTFADVWASYDSFSTDYGTLMPLVSGGITPLTSDNIQALYYLLYAKYGNTPIICEDEMQWKIKMMSVITTYGPTWQRKKAIQVSLRALDEDDLVQGAKQIYNHAFNPSTEPATSELEELTHINDQNTSNNKKSKMEAYSILWANLHVDSTDEFMQKFNKCFSRFVGDQFPTIFVTEEEEEEEE